MIRPTRVREQQPAPEKRHEKKKKKGNWRSAGEFPRAAFSGTGWKSKTGECTVACVQRNGTAEILGYRMQVCTYACTGDRVPPLRSYLRRDWLAPTIGTDRLTTVCNDSAFAFLLFAPGFPIHACCSVRTRGTLLKKSPHAFCYVRHPRPTRSSTLKSFTLYRGMYVCRYANHTSLSRLRISSTHQYNTRVMMRAASELARISTAVQER